MKKGNGKQDEVHKHVSFHSLNLYFCKRKRKTNSIYFLLCSIEKEPVGIFMTVETP
jgi:hypothetical protein